MKQEVIRHKSSRLFLSTSPANNRSSFHTEVDCQMADNAGGAYGGDKLTLIFCAMKCHCGHNHYDDVCFCCQLSNDGSGGPVCYDKLVDCQANCPLCNPKCPPAPSLVIMLC
nr:unnamed protein product [Digitaria exilis]